MQRGKQGKPMHGLAYPHRPLPIHPTHLPTPLAHPLNHQIGEEGEGGATEWHPDSQSLFDGKANPKIF